MESAVVLDRVSFVLRYFHTFAGLIWIGILYYFNFVQGAFFNETDAATKSAATQKLVPRALWWFRWAAFWTMLLGILLIGIKGHISGSGVYESSWGINILTGAIMGLIMGCNVWFIIWPNQKVIIQNAVDTAAGKPANPAVPGLAAKAGLASRTNTLFSIPMLFFMGAASHWIYAITETSKVSVYVLIAAIIIIGIELNALFGKTGPMTTIKGVITSGFILTIIFAGIICTLM
jgi:uncharacterized membrane protein